MTVTLAPPPAFSVARPEPPLLAIAALVAAPTSVRAPQAIRQGIFVQKGVLQELFVSLAVIPLLAARVHTSNNT